MPEAPKPFDHRPFEEDRRLPPLETGPFRHRTLLMFEGYDTAVSTEVPLVLVLVEKRLLDAEGAGTAGLGAAGELLQRLERFNADLRKDGFDSRFLSIDMWPLPAHRDGEGVLALRQFFKATRTMHPTLAGAILVGAFPEAMLVRRWIWRKNGQDITINGTKYSKTDYLRVVPEIVADRSDLPLADLSGNWPSLYQAGPTALASVVAIPDESTAAGWPHDGALFTSSTYQITQPSFSDFFWIRDDDLQIIPLPSGSTGLILRMFTTLRNPEIDVAEAAVANPVARPDIFISRINARNIARSPDPTLVGTSGETFLDTQGKPQTLRTVTPLSDYWLHDLDLERRLIIDYFDRNHMVRQGISPLAQPFRTSAIHATNGPSNATDLSNYLEKASITFKPPVKTDNADIVEFVKWLKEPAILRAITAHANCCHTDWGPGVYAVGDLESEAGGKPWRWRQTAEPGGFRYDPSFASQGASGDFHIYRTIWENRILAGQFPGVLIHSGCQVNSPCGASSNAFEAQAYASRQEAEGHLFYLNTTAVIARAKVFNDWPRDFPAALAKPGARLGDGLLEYFNKDGSDANLGKFQNAASCKRCYWWAILGDWTLKLAYPPAWLVNFIAPELRVIPLRGEKWMVADADSILKVLDGERDAQRIVDILRQYGLDQRCTIGGEEAVFEFYLRDGELPCGELRGEVGFEVDADELQITVEDGWWLVLSGRNAIARLRSEDEAWAVVDVMRETRPAHFCWVGDQREPLMTLLRR